MFFLFFSLSHPVLAIKMAGKRFFNFLISFFLFFWNFLAQVEYELNLGLNCFFFFLSFWSYLIPFWLKIMSERGFLIFSNFLLVFWNFLVWVKYERNSGVKFFSLFLGLSHPVLTKNNVGKRFFNFFKFFVFFLEFSCPEEV